MMKCQSNHQKFLLKNLENLVIHQINKNLPIIQFNKPHLSRVKKSSIFQENNVPTKNMKINSISKTDKNNLLKIQVKCSKIKFKNSIPKIQLKNIIPNITKNFIKNLNIKKKSITMKKIMRNLFSKKMLKKLIMKKSMFLLTTNILIMKNIKIKNIQNKSKNKPSTSNLKNQFIIRINISSQKINQNKKKTIQKLFSQKDNSHLKNIKKKM